MDTYEMMPFKGTAVKMQLVSNGICYGPCPMVNDEVEQRVTITPTHIWVSRYTYGDGFNYGLQQKFNGRIARENGEAILAELGTYFSDENNLDAFATDVGSWELILTNEEGDAFKFFGSLISLNTELDSICDDMRERLDMPFLFLFNGDDRQDKITRLTIEYSRTTKIKSNPEHNVPYEFVTWNYAEKITIDRESETLEYFRRIGEECDTTWKYHVAEGVPHFLDDIDIDMFDDIEGNPPDAMDDPMESKSYKIIIEFAHMPDKVITGSFDRLSLPSKWPSFAKDLKEFMRFYGEGEVIDRVRYEAQKQCPGDIIYLSVTFGEHGKRYYYRTEDNSIEIGNWVVVPVGTDGKERIVKVEKKEYFREDNVPMPLDRVKSVIEVFNPPESGEAAMDCPVLNKKITMDECYEYCLSGFDVPTDEEAEECDLKCEKCRYYED